MLRALELRTHSHSHSASRSRTACNTVAARFSSVCACFQLQKKIEKRGKRTVMSAVAFFFDGERSSDHVWVHYRPLVRVFLCCRRPRRPAFVIHHGPEVQEDETFLFALEKIRDASQEGGPRFLRPLSKGMTSPRCSSRLLRPLNHQEWM